MNDALRDKLQPDGDGLLALLAGLVDDSMLDEIADADRGEGAELHRAALAVIRDELRIPSPMAFEPAEVLALTRWSDPDDPRWRGSDAQARRGHAMRAFCCTALLMAGDLANPHCFSDDPDTLAQLVASLAVLGVEAQRTGLRFLVWRFAGLEAQVEERPYYLLAILLLALEVRRDLAPPEIFELVADLIAEEEAVRSGGWAFPEAESGHWLLGLLYGQLNDVWRAQARRLAALAAPIADERVRRAVVEVGERLLASPA